MAAVLAAAAVFVLVRRCLTARKRAEGCASPSKPSWWGSANGGGGGLGRNGSVAPLTPQGSAAGMS